MPCSAEPLEPRQLFAAVPHGFHDSTFVSGFTAPTAMEFAPDGRLFVTEQGGDLRVVTKAGALLPTPFLHVDTTTAGERGLLGVTLDPNFETNGFIYIYYTVPGANGAPLHNRVSRFTADGNTAAPFSETPILDLDPLNATNHNGGGIHFGPDGKLYVGVGENVQPSNAQTFANRLGKLLRINSDGSIPTDNPFFNIAAGANRAIWAFGLRNPFTFAFQRGTGRLFINDVGLSTFEEIDDGIAGANYGWPATEGPTSDPQFVSPLLAYGHGNTTSTGIAITGGAFYNPAGIRQFPSTFVGDYFYADLGSGWIRRFDPISGTDKLFATGIQFPVDLDVTDDGSLYYLARNGTVGQIRSDDAHPPRISKNPKSHSIHEGDSVTFRVRAKALGTFSYQWLRNGIAISGATSRTFTLTNASRATDNHVRFRVIVTNEFGSTVSKRAKLSVGA